MNPIYLFAVTVCLAQAAPWPADQIQNILLKHDFNTNSLPPITSIAQMDAANLRGIKYNDTQPLVTNPHEFDGYRIAIVASHCFEDLQV
jgi:hypothetical protein